jgi:integrase
MTRTYDLPPNVNAVPDRHGKIRYRFRRKGWPSAYLPGEPGSAAFHAAYADILAKGEAKPKSVKSPRKVIAGSLDDLFARVRQSVRWQRKTARVKHNQSRKIERFLDRISESGKRYGTRQVSSVTVAWLDNAFAKMADTPAAANETRKLMSVMFDHAIKIGLRTDNPARMTDKFPEGEEGFHTWTEAEIAQYRATYPVGTMARVVLELALNTAARRGNVAALTRDDLQDGRIIVAHIKGNNVASVPILPETQEALDAMPVTHSLVVSERGTPFTVESLGNRMRKWCRAAGLPHCSLHGLRKAVARRLAEGGATDAEGQAVTGHKKATTFQHYRAKADRKLLADRAMAKGVQPAKVDKE